MSMKDELMNRLPEFERHIESGLSGNEIAELIQLKLYQLKN